MLVVEDNPDHLELTLATLIENGCEHEIFAFNSGEEALDFLFCEGIYADRPNDLPELVLLDLGLPKMSGFDVMQRMRDDSRTFFVPVVMLTSASEQSERVLAFTGGLNSYIAKPLLMRDFEHRLAQVREYWRTSNFAPLGSTL